MDNKHGLHARRQLLNTGAQGQPLLRTNTVPSADSYESLGDGLSNKYRLEHEDCAMDVEAHEGATDVRNRSRCETEQDPEFIEELWQWASSAMSEPDEGLSAGATLCVPCPPPPPLAARPYTFPHTQHTVSIPAHAHAQPSATQTLSGTTHIQRPRFVVRRTDANPLGGFLEVASPEIMDKGKSTRTSCSSRGTTMQFAAADAQVALDTDPIKGRRGMPMHVALSRSASTMSPAPQPSEPPAFRRAISAPQTPTHESTRKVNAPSAWPAGRTGPGLDGHVKERFMSPAIPVDEMSVCEGVVQGVRATDIRIPPSIVSVLSGPIDGERSIEQLYASLDYAGKREYRRQSLERWLEKRSHRSSERRVVYTRRSLLASQRMRVGGKFVKQSVGFVSVTELRKSKPSNVADGIVVQGLSKSHDRCTYPTASDESGVEVEDEKDGCSALSDRYHVS